MADEPSTLPKSTRKHVKLHKFIFGTPWLPDLLCKHLFASSVWNFCCWVADVPPRETFPAAKSEEKRMFSQARSFVHLLGVNFSLSRTQISFRRSRRRDTVKYENSISLIGYSKCLDCEGVTSIWSCICARNCVCNSHFAKLYQVITFTNRIWPDLAFGFVDKRSGYEIKLFSDVAIVVTYTPYLLDLSMDVRLCVKWMLCDVSFLEVPYSVMSVILYFRIGKSYWEESTY